MEPALRALEDCVTRLARSQKRLALWFPLTAAQQARLRPEQQEAIDAFLKRFEQTVSTLQDQVFRSIARIEGEDLRTMSRRDLTEFMARLQAIPSAARFGELVVIRNRLAHVYPEQPERQVAILNAAFDGSEALIDAAAQLGAFAAGRYGVEQG